MNFADPGFRQFINFPFRSGAAAGKKFFANPITLRPQNWFKRLTPQIVIGGSVAAITGIFIGSHKLGQSHIQYIINDKSNKVTHPHSASLDLFLPTGFGSWNPVFQVSFSKEPHKPLTLEDDQITEVDSFSEPFWADF
jgi:hypothetical protein